MEKQKNILIGASAFFFGCVALDVIQLIRAIAEGAFKFNVSVTGASAETTDTAIMIATIILLAIGSIGTIIKLYLAVKGLRQAHGTGGKGRGHIKWAKVIVVLLVIGVIGTVTNVAQGTEAWYTLISPVISLIAAFFYVRSASALKEA